jgi:uncharacterized protein YukE
MASAADAQLKLVESLSKFVEQSDEAHEAMQKLAKAIDPLADVVKESSTKVKDQGGAMAGLQAAMGGMVAGVQAAAGAFSQAASAMRPFVEAFSPSAILMFDAAMRDLSAVIGSALLPIFNVLTMALRGFASILLPVVQTLGPAIERITGVLTSMLAGGLESLDLLAPAVESIVELFAVLMEALQPVIKLFQSISQVMMSYVSLLVNNAAVVITLLLQAIKPLLDIFTAATPIWKALSVIIAGVTNAIKVWAQSLSLACGGEFVEDFTGAMRQLARAAILAAAALAKMLGLEGFVEGMKKALGGERRGAAGFAAPQDARVQSDIQAFARQMAEAAATATGAGGETKTAEQKWQADLLNELKTLKEDELWKKAENAFFNALKRMKDAAGVVVHEATVAAAKPAVAAATGIAADVAVYGVPGGIARNVARRVGW